MEKFQMENTNKETALSYLRRGFSVIPLDKKVPRIEWIKYQTQRPTENEINNWWNQWPDANIGIVTGAISGIIVVDVDGGKIPEFPKTPTVETSPGKRHFYFIYPGFVVPNSAKLIADNIDVRGDGGYVVAPPSQHFNKETGEPNFKYKWVISPDRTPFTPLPDWVLEKLKSPESIKPLAQI